MKEVHQQVDAKDWRWLIVTLAFGYAIIVFGVATFSGVSEQHLLQGLGVPALKHPFMDMRGVASWCEASATGHDPSVEQTWINFTGEVPRPNYLMNYSPVVLCLAKLGLSQHSVVTWSLACGLIFSAALWFLCGSCSLTQALIWTLMICSPSSVLLVERGNLDTLLFALIVVGLLLRRYPLAESGLILFASLIKFFPIVALLACWKEKGGRVPVILAAAVFSLFLLFLSSRLASISGSLAGQFQSAFGCGVLTDILAHHGIISGTQIHDIHGMVHFIALTVLGMSFIAGWRFFREPMQHFISERSNHAFFLGAPIMMGLFLIGNQMDYKWVFFLLMVPATLEFVERSCGVGTCVAKIWMVTMISYSYWTFFSDEGSLRNAILKQLLMWVVMLLTAFLAGRLWTCKSER